MKLKYLIITITTFWTGFANAQFVNNGAEVTVQSEAIVHIQGDFIHQDGLIDNAGAIEIGQNWVNNGGNNPIVDTDGMVDLVGADQLITGSFASSFNELHFNGEGDKTLEQDIQINEVLNLENANLVLNEQRLTINNSVNTSITRNNGWVISETDTNYGWLQWNMGTNAATYEIPFGNTDTYLPLEFDVTTNGMGNGNLSFATYPTTATNNPLPNGVTNLDINGENDSLQMADRFWLIEDNDYVIVPTANLQFTYDANDILTPNIINPDSLRVTQWDGLDTWGVLSSLVNDNQVSAADLNTFGVFTLRSQDATTGIFSVNVPSVNFEVYPNPIEVHSTITIQLESEANANALISLLDVQGRLIMNTTNFLTTGNNQLRFEIPDNISAGQYFLIIQTAEKVGSKKLFIH